MNNEMTLKEAARKLARRALTFPGIIMGLFTIAFGIGLFSPLVEVQKFETFATVYQVVFLGWAVAGVAKKKVDSDAITKLGK